MSKYNSAEYKLTWKYKVEEMSPIWREIKEQATRKQLLLEIRNESKTKAMNRGEHNDGYREIGTCIEGYMQYVKRAYGGEYNRNRRNEYKRNCRKRYVPID